MPPTATAKKTVKKKILLKDKQTKDLNEFELDDLRISRDTQLLYEHEACANLKPPNIKPEAICVRQRYGRTIKKATKLESLDIRQAKAWLCLSCLVPQYGNLRRHEIFRCPCRGKDHKGLYPMNALGTDIERNPR
jgi:hypothetical protein